MTDPERSFRWMTTKKRRRLHALAGERWQASVEALLAGEYDERPVRFACGMTTVVFYPGQSERFGLARCLRCGKATRTPSGWGWPVNGN